MFQNNLLMGAASISAGGLTVDNSVRYNDDDSPRLYRTPSVAGNRMIGSISLWYKRCNLGSIQQLFNAGAGDDITFNASDKLTFTDSSGVSYITTQVFRDPSAWGHLLFAWDTTLAAAGDRLRIYHNGVEITAFDTETNPSEGDAFEISNTVRQTIGANESDTEEFDGYLSQFYYVDGQQLTPSSFGESDDNGVWRPIAFAGGGTGYTGDVVPVMTGATSPSGEVTVTGTYTTYYGYKAFDHQPWAASNAGWINSGTGEAFIAYEFASSKTITMYTIMSRNAPESPEDFTFDGWNGSAWVELDSVTGESWTGTGQTKVYKFTNTTAYIKYRLNTTLVQTHESEYCAVMNLTMHEASSGYSTNGFFLDFADSSDFGNDTSGNSNDYTSSGLAANDQVSDTPTDNFCVMSPIDKSSSITLSNGNLTSTGSGGWYHGSGTLFASSGKWYYEWTPDSGSYALAGWITNIPNDHTEEEGDPETAQYRGIGAGLGVTLGNQTTITSVANFAVDDVIMMAIDIDTGEVWVGVNGTWEDDEDPGAGGTPVGTWTSFTGTAFAPWTGQYSNANSFNFGQTAFAHTIPTGFSAWSTANLPAPQRIDDVDSQFVGAYDTGTNIVATLNAARNETWTNYINMYRLVSTSGTGANWQFSDDTSNQLTLPGPSPGAKSSFVNPSVTSASGSWNGYTWRVGAEYGVYTAEISHTNGSDTDQAHGLTSDSSRFMAHSKRSDAADEWWIVHPDLSSGNNINFYWAAEVATEYVTVDGTNVTVKATNATGTYRVIVWAEMSGWRKFSKFEGNTNVDGPFLWVGGTPKLHVAKRSTAGEDYHTNLRARDPNGNPMTHQVTFDWTNGETTTMPIDGTAGGVKLRMAPAQANGPAMITWQECTPFGGDGVSPATAV